MSAPKKGNLKMSNPIIVPVIMSGGAGTRLWPLSCRAKPKQLHDMFGEHTLLQETVLRVPDDAGFTAPIIICAQAHIGEISKQMQQIGVNPAQIIAEPMARNTAPCALIAAYAVAKEFGEDALVLLLAADHFIVNARAFRQTIRQGAPAAADGKILTFGPKPTRPETGYGYLLSGAKMDQEGVYRLDKFVEKPDLETAKAWVRDGRYLWNSGMFLFRAGVMQDEMKIHRAKIAQAAEQAWAKAIKTDDHILLDPDAFAACPPESVDHAVMEHTDKGAVIALDAGWSDVGSWQAIYELSAHDENGNACQGSVVALDSKNCLLRSDGIQIATAGIKDMAVIAIGNSVLVLPLCDAQKVKEIVGALPKEAL